MALLALAALAACGNQEESKTESDMPQLESSHLDSAGSALENTELGTEREGIDEKDLEKKSADFDPNEVKLGKEKE